MKPRSAVAVALFLIASPVSAQQPSEPLPSSSLPLRLVGVLHAPSVPGRSAGVIQCGASQEKRPAWLYATGDRACDVAEVVTILDASIVIRNLAANRLELLTLPQASARPAPVVAPPDPVSVDTEPEEPTAPLALPGPGDVITIEIRREVLRRHLANLPEVLSSALATPHRAASGGGPPTTDGYELTGIKAGSIVEQLGLQEGDVVMDVDGQSLSSVSAVTGLLGKMEALSDAKMTVLRRGKRVTFAIRVR